MTILRFVFLLLATVYILNALPIHGTESRNLRTGLLESRNLRTGLLISDYYACGSLDASKNPINTSSTSDALVAVVDNFCDLFSYYEMIERVLASGQVNSTSTNSSTTIEGNTEEEVIIEILSNLQVLLKENLKDTCNFISHMEEEGEITVSDPEIFNSDSSCSLNNMAVFRGLCVRHRLRRVTTAALEASRSATGDEDGIDSTQWLNRFEPATRQQIIRYLPRKCA